MCVYGSFLGRKVIVIDVSKKYGMEYCLIRSITMGHPWYGECGYQFGFGSIQDLCSTDISDRMCALCQTHVITLNCHFFQIVYGVVLSIRVSVSFYKTAVESILNLPLSTFLS